MWPLAQSSNPLCCLTLAHSPLDVKNAFLHGFLREMVLMEQPLGLFNPSYPKQVCKLNKAIYLLKQGHGPCLFRSSCFLFFFSNPDSSLFILHCSSGAILLLLYVDDIIVTSNNPSLQSRLIAKLSSKFSMKDLGHLHYFLGIEISTFPGCLFFISI